MSERKVLNKYYPPEFDPSKIPKLKQGKNRTFSIRIMAPFNMRCDTCGEYIYKGKKFNSRKENVDDEFYLGLRIFRFYIKCPRCVAEIAFKTDLANTDYALEAGATRLFEAEKLAHQMAEKERKEKEEDELNPMKVLENRTKASRNEMDQLDQLEELKEINARHARVDHESMLEKHMAYEEQLLKLQEEEEDKLVQAILKGGSRKQVIHRIEDNSDEEEEGSSAKKAKKETTEVHSNKPTDVLTESPKVTTEKKKPPPWQLSVGNLSTKSSLAGLVRKKASTDTKKQCTSTALSSTGQQNTAVTVGNELKSGPKEAGQNGTTGSKVELGNKDEAKKTASSSVSSLSLLGNYSDSDTGTETD